MRRLLKSRWHHPLISIPSGALVGLVIGAIFGDIVYGVAAGSAIGAGLGVLLVIRNPRVD